MAYTGDRQMGILEQLGVQIKVPAPAKWQTAKLRFLGAEGYVLGTRSIEMKLLTQGKGVCIEVKKKLELDCNLLLGAKCEEAPLVDVQLVIKPITLSLASLTEGLYPITMRRGETVELL